MQELSDIHFSEFSMVDDFGRVFYHNDKIYRAIRPEKKSDCLEKLNSDLFKELTEKQLIPFTTVTDLKVEGYDLVIEHEKLLNTKQHEWSFNMLKEASQMVLEVNRICNKYGCELKDAHTLNVLFRGSQPVYIDIGSITTHAVVGSWVAYKEFLSSFIIPLTFWSRNRIYIARKMLESNFHRMVTLPEQSLVESGLLELLETKDNNYLFRMRSVVLFNQLKKDSWLSRVANASNGTIKKVTGRNTKIFSFESKVDKNNYYSQLFPVNSINEFVCSLTAPAVASTWQGYHQKFYSNDDNINYSDRFLRLLDMIRQLEDVNTVIDLAGNEGYFSILLNKEIQSLQRIVLADYDANAIDSAYNYLKSSGQQKVEPVLLNFMFTPDLLGTSKRLSSDIAIALAVTHHLILTAHYSLPAIFERLKLYSKKYVMIEFMPLGLWSINDTEYPSVPEWYTQEWFRNWFVKYFDLLLEEKLEKNRVVFLGKIK